MDWHPIISKGIIIGLILVAVAFLLWMMHIVNTGKVNFKKKKGDRVLP